MVFFLFTYCYIRHRRNLENLNPYQKFHIKSGVLNWEEQSAEDSIRDNIYAQESKAKNESTKSPIDKLPTPSPRYGHAACRYDGQSYTYSKYEKKN